MQQRFQIGSPRPRPPPALPVFQLPPALFFIGYRKRATPLRRQPHPVPSCKDWLLESRYAPEVPGSQGAIGHVSPALMTRRPLIGVPWVSMGRTFQLKSGSALRRGLPADKDLTPGVTPYFSWMPSPGAALITSSNSFLLFHNPKKKRGYFCSLPGHPRPFGPYFALKRALCRMTALDLSGTSYPRGA